MNWDARTGLFQMTRIGLRDRVRAAWKILTSGEVSLTLFWFHRTTEDGMGLWVEDLTVKLAGEHLEELDLTGRAEIPLEGGNNK